MCLLSIIVPVYNVEKYLSKCLDSLLQQDIPHSEYEIIVVNDGSTDGSLSIAEDYARKNENIILISQENKGLSGARNTGIDNARGKYLMFVDSDDYLEMNSLGDIIDFSYKNDLDVLRFEYKKVYEDGSCLYDKKLDIESYHIKPAVLFLTQDLGILCYVCLYLFKTEILKSNNLYFKDEIYFEDVEWLPRVLLSVGNIGYVDKIVYNYLQRKGSITLSQTLDKKRKLVKDKLGVVDSMLKIESSTEDKRVKKWCESMNAFIILTWLSFISKNLYEEKKDWLRKLKVKNLFPLSLAPFSLKNRMKLMIINVSPSLYIWLVNSISKR